MPDNTEPLTAEAGELLAAAWRKAKQLPVLQSDNAATIAYLTGQVDAFERQQSELQSENAAKDARIRELWAQLAGAKEAWVTRDGERWEVVEFHSHEPNQLEHECEGVWGPGDFSITLPTRALKALGLSLSPGECKRILIIPTEDTP